MRAIAMNEKKPRFRRISPAQIVNLRALHLDETAFRLDGDGACEPARRLADRRPFLVARREYEVAHLAGL